MSVKISNPVVISSIAELKALRLRPVFVMVLGTNNEEDDGGGVFRWSANSVETADDVFVLQCFTGPPGRYIRFSDAVSQAKVQFATNGIFVNSSSVKESYTIATGTNGLSSGPIGMLPGVDVNVSPGQAWKII